jgi:hypothetical protein
VRRIEEKRRKERAAEGKERGEETEEEGEKQKRGKLC